jgi:cytochrome c oxidase assembly protein subunit 16
MRATMCSLHAKPPTSLAQQIKRFTYSRHFEDHWRLIIVLPRKTSSMPTFQSNPFRPSTSSSAASLGERIGTTYRRHLANHPFLLFGLPFISVIVASSFLLTPATALRYERHDRKNRAVTHGEAMELGLKGLGDEEVNYNPRRRKVTKGGTTERDEYYVSSSQTVAERWGGDC